MATPATPRHLSTRSRKIFRWVITEYGFSDEPPAVALLTEALSALDHADACRQAVDKEGVTVTTRFGEVRPNPMLEAERKARQSFSTLLRELALSPDVADGPRPPRAAARF